MGSTFVMAQCRSQALTMSASRRAALLVLVGVTFATSAIGQGPPPLPVPPTIGVAEIEAAKALLAQAKGALQPQQYELLERGAVEAQQAFQRYSALARTSGKAAEVARGAQALSGAQRVSQIAKGLGRVVGPALVALALLYPSNTATQEQDYPSWMRARDELEMKLRQVAADSQRVGEEIEAASRKKPQAAKKPVSLPDDTICRWVGVGGGGKPVICRYNCDGVEDTIEVLLPDSLLRCPGETSNPLKWEQLRRFPQRLSRGTN